MAQWLGAHIALPEEDLSSFPRTPVMWLKNTCHSCSQESNTLACENTCILVEYTHIAHAHNKNISLKKLKIKKNRLKSLSQAKNLITYEMHNLSKGEKAFVSHLPIRLLKGTFSTNLKILLYTASKVSTKHTYTTSLRLNAQIQRLGDFGNIIQSESQFT